MKLDEKSAPTRSGLRAVVAVLLPALFALPAAAVMDEGTRVDDAAVPSEPAPPPLPSQSSLPEQRDTHRPLAASALVLPREGVLVFGQLYTGFESDWVEGVAAPRFTLARADLGFGYGFSEHTGVLLRFETIRSAGPESLYGIDGNSLLARVRHGFGYARGAFGPVEVEARLGMVPDVFLDTVLSTFDLRVTGPLAAEQSGLFDTSDLGASVALSAWQGVIDVRLALTNGEGRAMTEQNGGKNTTVAASLRTPRFFLLGEPGQVGVHLVGREGSRGLASVASHRVGGALSFAHPAFHLGGSYVYGFGVEHRSDRQAHVLELWADSVLWPRALGAFARYRRFGTDGFLEDTAVHHWQGGLYVTLFADAQRNVPDRLRLYAGSNLTHHEELAGPLPGSAAAADTVGALVLIEATGFFLAALSQ
ncbi:MAG: hypothetical protein ACO3JL_17830 [Myxococcota bacterium]